MKTLYLECAMGASGDMLAGALSELIPDSADFCKKLNDIGLEEVRFSAEKNIKCGITGTKFKVLVNGEEEKSIDAPGHTHTHEHTHNHEYSHNHEHPHGHSSFADIKKRIAALQVSNKVKADIEAVYALIAEAESYVHNTSIDNIHFHEVGSADALADITAVCMLIEALSPDTIIASPVNVGSGHVHCAHGILPVPAPATARILRGIPVYAGAVQGELCTPTGAALLAHFAASFERLPGMKISAIGYGMGTKDFPQANCLRAFWGTVCKDAAPQNTEAAEHTENAENTERIIELSCNIDDMTGEALAFAAEILFENGALDVFTTPIGMKKSRPAVMLTCLCLPAESSRMADLILRHTSTLGVREKSCLRRMLPRSEKTVQTPYGSVRIKIAQSGSIQKNKIEYEDAARIARSQNIPLGNVYQAIEKTAQND
ncbi:nickel pincer cofactor biosynthesis protein LarC [Treponema sp. HNW]|uniref:nickel pincer cofactor biosynthesis protein LarC n=1 Tax=Treponema sp. HNW TaxID=3116654 RepID=UPI003D0AC85B